MFRPSDNLILKAKLVRTLNSVRVARQDRDGELIHLDKAKQSS